MKASFWNYADFSYVGSYEIAGDFSPTWDLLTPQNSTMKISAKAPAIEKEMICAVPGWRGRAYIGIVKDVRRNASSGVTEVVTKEILSILNVPVVLEAFAATDYSNPAEWLTIACTTYFGMSGDNYQNLNWLSFDDQSSLAASASPAWSSNTVSTLLSAYEEMVDAYGVYAYFHLGSTNDDIECQFKSASGSSVLDLRSDCISNVTYSNNSEAAVNKVVFKPMTDNYINTTTEYPFVLLSTGTISTDLTDANRLTPVVCRYEFYSDEDLGGTSADTSNIEQSATEILKVSKYSHEVKFKMRYHKTSTYLQGLFTSLLCGMIVTLYGVPGFESTPIESKVTQIKATGQDELEITCGYTRSQLTDKIKMRDRIDHGGKLLSYSILTTTAQFTNSKSFYSGNLPADNTYTFSFTLPKNTMLCEVKLYGTESAQISWPTTKMLINSSGYTYSISSQNGYVTVSITITDLTAISHYYEAIASGDQTYLSADLLFTAQVIYGQLATQNV